MAPAQQKNPGFSILLGWQRTGEEGFGAVFYLEFWELELKGTLAGMEFCPPLPGRIRDLEILLKPKPLIPISV